MDGKRRLERTGVTTDLVVLVEVEVGPGNYDGATDVLAALAVWKIAGGGVVKQGDGAGREVSLLWMTHLIFELELSSAIIHTDSRPGLAGFSRPNIDGVSHILELRKASSV